MTGTSAFDRARDEWDVVADLEDAGITFQVDVHGTLRLSADAPCTMAPDVETFRNELRTIALARQAAAMFKVIAARLDALESSPSRDDVKRERAIAKGLRFDVLRRDGFKCTYCGVRGNKRTSRRCPRVVGRRSRT